MAKPVTRLYEDYLLNEWVKNEKNQISLVEVVFTKKTGFIMKEIQGIINFKEIPFNISDQNNRHTNECLNRDDKKTNFTILERLYENKVKDYLVTARVKDILGLGFNVNILCDVRSRYLRSPYVVARINDQSESCNDDLYSPEQELGTRRMPDVESLCHKYFAGVILTTDTGSRDKSLEMEIMHKITVYKVQKKELDKIASRLHASKITK